MGRREVFFSIAILILAILAYFLALNDRFHGGNANVILISIDSLRADHLGCYGYARKTSPNIDQLAAEGVLISNAFTTSPWTLPAHLSMITSLYSESHGVITAQQSLDPKRITLAEVLKKEGYYTAAFVSGPLMNSIYGFDQGFDLYDDSINGASRNERSEDRYGHRPITSPDLTESIKKWLAANHKKKFFLFLHYFDVHYDYVPPHPFDTMFDPDYEGTVDARDYAHSSEVRFGINRRDLEHVVALYDGEIAFTDKYIGEVFSFLKQLGIYNKTLIALTADHGDEFFEHGGRGHKNTLYDEVLRVPLIFRFPDGAKQNSKIRQLASLVDIMPTVLGYLRIKSPEESQGRNLLALTDNVDRSDDFAVYSRLQNKLVGIRSSHAKLIKHLKSRDYEFYDLQNDPGEMRNLIHANTVEGLPEAQKHLMSLSNWLNAQSDIYRNLPKANKSNKIRLDESLKEQLRSLGYVQ